MGLSERGRFGELRNAVLERWWWLPVLLLHELVLLAATFFPLMSHAVVQHRQGYFWFQWDSLNYINIGQLGYTHLPGIFKYKEVAFFPFVPVLVRLITPWGVMLLQQVVFVLILLLLKQFSERMGLTSTQAIRATWLFAFSPVAIFYSTLYAEPWTLFAGLASLYFASRKRWYLAGIMGLITSMTQGSAILIGIFPLVLFVYAIFQRNAKLVWGALIWGIGCAVGLASYMAYLGYAYRNPLLFSTVQTTLWHAHWVWPGYPFLQGLRFGGLGAHSRLYLAYEIVALVYVLGAILMLFIRSIHVSWEGIAAKLYVVIGLLVSFSFYSGGTPFHSTLRIASVYFPMYLGLAKYLPSWLLWLIMAGFVVVGYAGTSLFTHGYFFQ